MENIVWQHYRPILREEQAEESCKTALLGCLAVVVFFLALLGSGMGSRRS